MPFARLPTRLQIILYIGLMPETGKVSGIAISWEGKTW